MGSMRCSLQLRPAQARTLSLRPFTAQNKSICRYVTVAQANSQSSDSSPRFPSTLSRILAAGAAALLLTAVPAPAALAELQTVPADQVTSLAKPLKVQTVNKGRVWLLFILGASSLFAITIVAENNEAWFPAISRANKAMAASAAAKKRNEEREELEEQQQFTLPADRRQEVLNAELEADAIYENAVAAGIIAARRPPSISAVDIPSLSSKTTAALEDPESTVYPAQLEVEAETEVEVTSHHEEESSEDEVSTSESTHTMEDAEEEAREGAAGATRAPLFEIGGDQIESSMKQVQERALKEMSVEDLQRELESRKTGAGQQTD